MPGARRCPILPTGMEGSRRYIDRAISWFLAIVRGRGLLLNLCRGRPYAAPEEQCAASRTSHGPRTPMRNAHLGGIFPGACAEHPNRVLTQVDRVSATDAVD